MKISILRVLVVLLLLSFFLPGQTNSSKATQSGTQVDAVGVLKPDDMAALLPTSVFFQGKNAPVETRNSGGIRLIDKGLMLVSLVDASGYSSQVQQKYQAYLMTETPLISMGTDWLRVPMAAALSVITDLL